MELFSSNGSIELASLFAARAGGSALPRFMRFRTIMLHVGAEVAQRLAGMPNRTAVNPYVVIDGYKLSRLPVNRPHHFFVPVMGFRCSPR